MAATGPAPAPARAVSHLRAPGRPFRDRRGKAVVAGIRQANPPSRTMAAPHPSPFPLTARSRVSNTQRNRLARWRLGGRESRAAPRAQLFGRPRSRAAAGGRGGGACPDQSRSRFCRSSDDDRCIPAAGAVFACFALAGFQAAPDRFRVCGRARIGGGRDYSRQARAHLRKFLPR